MRAGVYEDRAFTTFDAAAKAVVHAVAVYGKPVGILAWRGGHAQFVTGYSVTGSDPRTGSMSFIVNGVNLTDPLKTDAMRDKWITTATWRSGPAKIAFKPYAQKDSPLIDPIGGKSGNAEWYGRWVVIVPVQ
jgi:hypothetical protein